MFISYEQHLAISPNDKEANKIIDGIIEKCKSTNTWYKVDETTECISIKFGSLNQE